MIYPSIKELMEKVDSRYTLVIATAKRARQISEGMPPLVKSSSEKAVTIAINEIAQNKVAYTRNRSSYDNNLK